MNTGSESLIVGKMITTLIHSATRLEKSFDTLQLNHLLFAEAEQGDVHEALGKSELAAQLSQPFCRLCKLLGGCHLLIGLGFSALVSRHKVHNLFL